MIGEQLGSFQIESVLGTGAMGDVYRATKQPENQSVAVKVINGEVAEQATASERFRLEAKILQQFHHPNIVGFVGVGRSKGRLYLAMEYIEGKTLERVLEERGPLPWAEVVDLGIQLCAALQYSHLQGVVHRDLKPSNLMVSEQGQLKLTDFGIAKDLEAAGLTRSGMTVGTAAFMAPEQILGNPVSHQTDLYALGLVLYQMLTGQAAFSARDYVSLLRCHVHQPPPRPSARVPGIPTALDDLVVRLMAKATADRPQDAEAVLLALTRLQKNGHQNGNAVPPGKPCRASWIAWIWRWRSPWSRSA
jgi:serine/threonine-protein kinase